MVNTYWLGSTFNKNPLYELPSSIFSNILAIIAGDRHVAGMIALVTWANGSPAKFANRLIGGASSSY